MVNLFTGRASPTPDIGVARSLYCLNDDREDTGNAFPLCYNCSDATLAQARALCPPNATRSPREVSLSRQWIDGPVDGVMTLHLPTGPRPIPALIEQLRDFQATHVGRASAINCTTCQKPIRPLCDKQRRYRLTTRPDSVDHLALRCFLCHNLFHRSCCCDSANVPQGAYPHFVCPSCSTLFIRQQVEDSTVLNSFPDGITYSDVPYAFARPASSFSHAAALRIMAALLPMDLLDKLDTDHLSADEFLNEDTNVCLMKKEWDSLRQTQAARMASLANSLLDENVAASVGSSGSGSAAAAI